MKVPRIQTQFGPLRCFTGERARRRLFRLYGIPNAYPGPLRVDWDGPCALFLTRRALFIERRHRAAARAVAARNPHHAPMDPRVNPAPVRAAWIIEPRPAFWVEVQLRTEHGVERRVFVILAANGEKIAETYHADAAAVAADAFSRAAAIARPKGRNREN